MADMETLRLVTDSPLFDPGRPIVVNGYTFVPAEREYVEPQKPTLGRPHKTIVEVKRRKLLIEPRRSDK